MDIYRIRVLIAVVMLSVGGLWMTSCDGGDNAVSQDGNGGSSTGPVLYLTDLALDERGEVLTIEGWNIAGHGDIIRSEEDTKQRAALVEMRLNLDTKKLKVSSSHAYPSMSDAVEAGAIEEPTSETLRRAILTVISSKFELILPTNRVWWVSGSLPEEEWGIGVLAVHGDPTRPLVLYWPFDSVNPTISLPEYPLLIDCREGEGYCSVTPLGLSSRSEAGEEVDFGVQAGDYLPRRDKLITPELKTLCAGWQAKSVDEWDAFEVCDWLDLLTNADRFGLRGRVAEPSRHDVDAEP